MPGDPSISIENETLEGLSDVEYPTAPTDDQALTWDDTLQKWVPETISGLTEGELRLTPKSSSSGPEGTMFYDSDDDHVYVATE